MRQINIESLYNCTDSQNMLTSTFIRNFFAIKRVKMYDYIIKKYCHNQISIARKEFYDKEAKKLTGILQQYNKTMYVTCNVIR